MRRVYLLITGLLLVAALSYGQTIQSSGAGSGNWNDPLSWSPNTVPNSGNSSAIIINNAHTITVTAPVTIDQTTINSGGAVIINTGVVLTLANGTGDEITVSNGGTLTINGTLAFGSPPNRTVVVNGTMNNSGTLSSVNAAKLTFGASSNYFHQFADGGAIPTATWNATSTVNIVGYTSGNSTPPSGLSQNFGHFVWNAPNQDSPISLGGLPTNIAGDFIVSDTGIEALFYSLSGAGGTTNIGGNFDISGGVLIWTSGDAGSSTINITGSMNITGGYTQLGDDQNLTINLTGNLSIAGDVDMSATSAVTNINVQGNYSFIAGDIFVNGGTGNINFTGASVKSFTSTLTPTGNVNYSVASLSTLVLSGSNFVAGGGTFMLSGTLQIGSTDASGALQTGTSGGNVRVSGTRTYSSGSTIVYNGTGAQFIGNGFPSGGDVNLVINNSSNVTLSTSLDIVALRTLTLTSGNIVIGTQTLTINGTVTGSGGIVGGPLSNLVIGGTGAFGTLNFSGTNQLFNFTMNRTGSGSVNLGGSLTILGTLTHTEGSLDLGSNTLTISGNYSRNLGTIGVSAASSVVINGSGTLPAGSAGLSGSSLGTLTLNRSGATLNVSATVAIANLNLFSGILNNGSGLSITTGGTITRNDQGSMTTAPNNIANAYNVVYDITSVISTGPELPINTNTTALANFTKQNSGTLDLVGDLTVNGVLTLSSGSFNTGSNDVDLKGNFVSNGGSTLTSSNVTFSGTTSISGSTTPVFGNITISSGGILTPTANFRINGNLVNNGTLNAGSATTTFGGTTVISGSSVCSFNNISIAAASTLTAPTGNMNVAGTWNNAGTFNSGPATNTVTFNGTTTFTGAGTTQFSGITITGTLTSSSTLRVAGNFTNNGTFNSNLGTLLLNGSSTQLLQGTTQTNFNNITISNVGGPPGVRVASNQDISGVLTLGANVTFDPDGVSGSVVFRLRSSGDNPTVDASIAALPGGATVQGSVTVQRYMAIEGGNNTRIYRYISSPVQSAPVSQIQSFIPVTGTFTGASSCSGCGSSQTLFRYNESDITGDLNTGYVNFPAATNTEMFASGVGYSIFVRGNIAPVSTAGSALYELRGPIFSGSVSLPVSFTSSGTLANDGWNLVGNPYPSSIDWLAASGWTKTNINDAIYMRDNGLSSPVIASFVGGVGVNGGSRNIAAGQAFFVKSDGGSPALQVTEAVKVAGTQTTFFREGAIPDLLRVTLKKGTTMDETAIRFHENATGSFDSELDAYKMKNSVFNLASKVGEVAYSINSIPSITCSSSIQLDISDAAVGTYEVDLSGMDSFEESMTIQLMDQFLNRTIDIRQQNNYSFEITADANSTGNRFKLVFSSSTDTSITPQGNDQLCIGNEYSFMLPSSETGVSYYASLNGTTISDNISGTGSSINIGIDESKLTFGENTVMVFAKRNSCDAVPLAQSLQIKVDEIYTIQSTTGGTSCQPGSVQLSVSGSPTNGTYNWYESLNSAEPIAGFSGNVFQTPVLAKSRTYFVAAVNSFGCEGEREEVTADVINYDDAAIEEVQYGVIKSNYSTGNAWFRNDVLLPNVTGQTIQLTESGIYRLEVTIGSCKTTDEFEFVVTGIEEPGKGIALYPNPVDDELLINGLVNSKAVTLLSPTGSQLNHIELRGQSSVKINMKGYSSGLYLIKVIGTNKSISTYKIMKR